MITGLQIAVTALLLVATLWRLSTRRRAHRNLTAACKGLIDTCRQRGATYEKMENSLEERNKALESLLETATQNDQKTTKEGKNMGNMDPDEIRRKAVQDALVANMRNPAIVTNASMIEVGKDYFFNNMPKGLDTQTDLVAKYRPDDLDSYLQGLLDAGVPQETVESQRARTVDKAAV